MECRSPRSLTLTTTPNDLDLGHFSTKFDRLTAWLETGASPQMFCFAADLVLTVELNAWHQNFRNCPLYAAQKKNAPLCGLQVALQMKTPKNTAKIRSNLVGQSDLLENRSCPLLHFGRLKGGPNYSPAKPQVSGFKDFLNF